MQARVREFSYDDIVYMQQVAGAIRKQIGVQTLMACGAREWKFLNDGIGLRFRVNQGSKRQFIEIALNSLDLYDITLSRIKRDNTVEILEEEHGIYCDQLRDTVYHMVNK
jgi:hypothetical protein